MDASTQAAPASPDTDGQDAPVRGVLREFRWMALVVIAMIAVQIVFFKPFYIPSVSMMPTLITGDRLMVAKYPYGWSWASMVPRVLPRMPGRILEALPERGDIVTAVPPHHDVDYIKRVIGLPGDTVEVADGRLILNGVLVPSRRVGTTDFPVDSNLTCRDGEEIRYLVDTPAGKRCRMPVVRETLPNGRSYDTIDLGYERELDDYGPVKVPPAHVFLMGDNRDQSADSRVSIRKFGLGGPVPLENVAGRAEIITFSVTGDWSLRTGRAGTGLHAARTGS